MSFGWTSPFPLAFGGGPTEAERIYEALRSAAGKGGSAADGEGSIDGLRRRVIARGIASVAGSGLRAALQAFPDHATDLLPYYEGLFGLTDDPDLSESERRQAAAQLYTLQLTSTLPELELALQRIDERFSLVTAPEHLSITTVPGRAFEDFAGAEPFGGGRQSTALPHYSSRFKGCALLDIGDGAAPSAAERRSLMIASRLMHDVLPGHDDFHVVTHYGFTVGVSLLGYTALMEEE